MSLHNTKAGFNLIYPYNVTVGISTKRGFTLIELLVVISIISLLSSVVISAVGTARTKARIQKATTEMATFAKVVSFAQGESGKTLLTMSANGGASISNCSQCVATCANPNVLSNVPVSNTCFIEWTKVLAGVKMNAGTFGDSLGGMQRDPWGSPYLVDQNQGESGLCANRDAIKSVGPDGINSTGDDIDYSLYMPLGATCP